MMRLRDFIEDYPDVFQECVSDIDWHKVFILIDVGGDNDLNDLADYLTAHFESYKEGLMPQDGPDHDAEYDEKRQAKADFGGICPEPDLSFLDAVHITNMDRDK